jgi:hypothetical protein
MKYLAFRIRNRYLKHKDLSFAIYHFLFFESGKKGALNAPQSTCRDMHAVRILFNQRCAAIPAEGFG